MEDINQDKPKRKTKGIWIPIEIWEHKDLTLQEKVFIAEIDSLDNDHGCWASNEYFSKHFDLSKNRVSAVISSLVDKGFLTNHLIYKPNSKEISKRILRVTSSLYPSKSLTPLYPESGIPYTRNQVYPIPGNAKDNSLSFNSLEEHSLKDIGKVATQLLPDDIKKDCSGISKKEIIQKKAERILSRFNILRNEFRQKNNLKKSSGFSPTEGNLKQIITILNKGKSYKDCIKILENKIQDKEFVLKDWYVPETLFREIKFQKYLDYDPKQYNNSRSQSKPSNGSGISGTVKYKNDAVFERGF